MSKPRDRAPCNPAARAHDLAELESGGSVAAPPLDERGLMLAALIDATSDAVYVKDTQGHYLLFNRAAEAVTGKSAAEVLGTDDTAVFAPAEAAVVIEGDRRAMAAPAPVTYEEVVTDAAGVVRTYLSTKGPVRDEAGTLLGLFGIARDITERKHAEEQLAGSEARLAEQTALLRSVLESSEAAVFALDRQYRYTAFNARHAETMRALYGVEIELGRSLLDYQRAAGDDIGAKRNLDRALAGERFADEGFSGDEGRTRAYFEVTHAPVHDPAGLIVGVSVFARDTTARHRAEEERRDTQALIDQTQEIARIGGWKWEATTNAVTWTDEVYRIHELARDEYDPNSAARDIEFYAPEGRARIAEAFRLAASEGQPYDLELPFVTARGRELWIRTSGHPEIDNGRVVRIYGDLQDITEAKLAAELIRTARARLEEAQRIAHVGSWEWDPVVDEISGSNEFYRLFDAAPEDLARYAQFAERIHPDDRERVDRDVADALKAMRPYDTDYRARVGDGGWRDISARGHVVSGPDGTPVRFLGTVLDITERKRAEAEVRAASARLRRFVDSAVFGFTVTRADGRVVEANDYYLDVVGFSREELERGEIDWRTLTPAEWLPADERGLAEMLERGSCSPYEKEYLRRDGSRVSVILAYAALPDSQDLAVFVLDISQRKSAEDRLRQASEELAALNAELEERVRRRTGLIEASLDALVTISPDGVVTDANAATEEVTGVPRHRLIGTQFSDYFTEPDLARSGYEAVLADGTVRDYPLTICHLSGKTTDVLYNAALYANDEGEVQGIFAAARDVTERRRAEEALRRRTAALEAANRELEAFSYSVSHDLRAPLRAIDGFSTILLRGHADQLDSEGQRLLGVVLRNVGQMGVLIDDLLGFSRVARQELDSRPVEMGKLARLVTDELAAAEPGRGIEFELGNLCMIPGDTTLLRQVWANLLGNAAKYTRPVERPRIEVRCEQVAGECRYTVRDNGVGFDPAYAANLFQPFHRLHSTAEFEGTGIGLAIVARIVQRHGGRVWAESMPGAGATFGFALPTETETP